MSSMKPFRVGIIVRGAASRTEWADKVRKVENLGYSSLTVPDQLTDWLAPMPGLVNAAEPTKRRRLGPTELN
ncbi:MAG: LLM class F420-dependent oxidoreductase, partial [bacterium]